MVIGDVEGRLKEVVAKANALHQKNNFAFALIVGSLFADPSAETENQQAEVQDLVNGKVEFQLPTYFALGRNILPQAIVDALSQRDGELCENLHFLGRRATLKTSDGIRIVALGGKLDPNITSIQSGDSYAPLYTEGDAKSLKGAHSADILVTTDWPAPVWKGSSAASPAIKQYGEENSQTCIAALNSKLRPRYHFTASPTFYEREPFVHSKEGEDPGWAVTRFISLAPYGNSTKQKWIYAFALDAQHSLPHEVPPNSTSSPFRQEGNTKRAAQETSWSRFSQADTNRPAKRRKGPAPGPDSCFFCFDNPNFAQHIVCAIGDEAYMTLAKGPLTLESTFSEIDFNCHVLIIPMAHAPIFAAITDHDERRRLIKEMNAYRSALHKMLDEKSNSKLGGVSWEISRSTGVHIHWQFMPVPADLLKRGLVEAAFKVEAENDHYPAFEAATGEADEEEASDSFKLWLWTPGTAKGSEGTERRLSLPLDSSFRFDIQFGRRVMAKLLSLDDRVSWRNCEQSVAEETADAEAFKAAFEKHDPSP